MAGRAVWADSCFRIENEDGHLWVTELLHTERGDVPKRWRITFAEPENARQWIGARLRDSHDRMYHFHTQRAVGQ